MANQRTRLLAAAMLAIVAVPALAQMGFSGGYAFLKAVRERDGTKVMATVTDGNSTIINSRDPGSGEGALHILVKGRDHNWLNFLSGRGARVDLQDDDGATPLLLAAQIGWVQGVELLLGRGANVNLANNRGETPLILAVQRRDLPMVRLLLANRADLDQADMLQGYSALDYARRDPRATQIVREIDNAISRRRPATTD